MRYPILLLTLLLSALAVPACDSIPDGYQTTIPTVRDTNLQPCVELNYYANDTGDGLSPDVAPSVVTNCGSGYPDSFHYSCSICQWPAVAYVSNVDGSDQIAQPKPLPDAGCWQPTSFTTSSICFNDCGAASAAGCD